MAEEMGRSHGAEFEFVFIDDGSKDDTLSIMRALHGQDARVRYQSFSRNFGKAGIWAGLKGGPWRLCGHVGRRPAGPAQPAAGNAGRADQRRVRLCRHPRRTTRKGGEPPVRSFFCPAVLPDHQQDERHRNLDGARDFRLMTRQMVDAILSMGEYNPASPKGIFSWVGFRTKWLEYTNVERVAGTTKWNFWKLFRYSIDGIVGFPRRRWRWRPLWGCSSVWRRFLGILFVVVRALLFGDPTNGWPSLVCIVLLCSGVQLFCTGIVGVYLSKTYLETKRRPICILKETEERAARGQTSGCRAGKTRKRGKTQCGNSRFCTS